MRELVWVLRHRNALFVLSVVALGAALSLSLSACGGGHFLMREAPERVNQEISDFVLTWKTRE